MKKNRKCKDENKNREESKKQRKREGEMTVITIWKKLS